jgi:hypothetical protein
MNEREHTTKDERATKPAQDEVAKKAYAVYLKEGRPQGHAKQNWLGAEAQLQHAGSDHPDHHDHQDASL